MKRLIIVPLIIIVSLVGSLAIFYNGRYIPPRTPPPSVGEKASPAYVSSSAFIDTPTKRSGVLLIDESHFNSFSEQEISILLSRVTARGYEIRTVGSLST